MELFHYMRMYCSYNGGPFLSFLTTAQLRAGYIYTYDVTDVFVDQAFYAITPFAVSLRLEDVSYARSGLLRVTCGCIFNLEYGCLGEFEL